MFIVDEVPFNKEAWEWFSSRQQVAKSMSVGETVISNFIKPYMPENISTGPFKKTDYQQLDAGEMWFIFNKLYMLMNDILKEEDGPPLPISVSLETLKNELKLVENMMIYWSIVTNVTEERLGALDRDFWSSNRDSTNMRFCIYVYCMMNTMWASYERLKKITSGIDIDSIEIGNGYYDCNEFKYDETKNDEFMRYVIRECCAGDFDDFIISVKDMIANSVIGEYHIMLAKIKGYELLGMDKFDDMPKSEAWRRLYTTYFDREEDNFSLFYQTYTKQCYEFMLLSFLSIDNCGGVKYIPVYKIYSNDNFKTYERHVKPLINTFKIRKELMRLYKKNIKYH